MTHNEITRGQRVAHPTGCSRLTSQPWDGKVPNILLMQTLRIILFAIVMFSAGTAFSAGCNGDAPESFTAFFNRFASDKAFAMIRTEYPLKTIVWEYGVDNDGNDAPKAKRSVVSKKADQSSPVLSSFMKKNGMESKVSKLTKHNAVVDVFKTDTDWQFSYHFTQRKGCWFLMEFQDHSL